MNTASALQTPRRSVSVFWPIVLIGVGVIWLMANQGIALRNPFELFLLFWPLLLVVAGIELLFNRTGMFGTFVSALLGIGVVAGAIFYLTTPGEFVAPTYMNWNWMPRNGALRTVDIGQPLENARALNFELHLPGGFASIKPVTNPVNLMEGQVSYLGELTNRVTRNDNIANVLLENDTRHNNWFDFWLSTQKWDVRLNPRVPLDLKLVVGSGAHTFDLREFDVKSIVLNQGSGATTLRLPQNGQYHMTLDVGSGIANIELPKGLAARVNYDVGSGWFNVNNLRRVRGDNEQGVYETDGFNQNGAYVIFDVDMGSGVVMIR